MLTIIEIKPGTYTNFERTPNGKIMNGIIAETIAVITIVLFCTFMFLVIAIPSKLPNYSLRHSWVCIINFEHAE